MGAPVDLIRVEQIMGMPIEIDVRTAGVDPVALDHAFDSLRDVDACFSTYRTDSEISRLNRSELALGQASDEVRAVLAQCEQLRLETDGFFDVAFADGRGLDPSGFVKGWAVDRAAQVLERRGARAYFINAGGDIRTAGGPEPGLPWRVGIRHPFEHDRVAAVVEVANAAIATSGAYERGDHVFNPHTHSPPGGVLSVTVIGPDLALADAYATAAFAMGQSGAQWLAGRRDYEAMVIRSDQTVQFTQGFPSVATD